MMDTQAHRVFLSPALPSDLLQFIINHCSYPTTLIICAGRSEFLASLIQDLSQHQQQYQNLQQHPSTEPPPPPPPHDTAVQQGSTSTAANPPPQLQQLEHKPHPLLTCPLSQLTVTRHVRTVFIPTVSHLRAFLSVFSSKGDVPAPPPQPGPGKGNVKVKPREREREKETGDGRRLPLLVVYDFLSLHRDTSEWSVQGLGTSAAVLVEAGRRAGLGVLVVEGARVVGSGQGAAGEERRGMGGLLEEGVPVLSGSARRTGGDLQGTGWAGKTVDVGRVLRRWFQFRTGPWSAGEGHAGGSGGG
ncbi:uncharacterized protein B0T15DRAFT_172074 [Chaetomium strumarium]|uniref:Uncharacterized protein n=1 Tax=Chaetomium strumarium TaxID=1170767 RepID=A0AAJ0M339_9PEZI|nr:hypothetical protein B0T15DRAFT_172074 [Chaetomium strumarium]